MSTLNETTKVCPDCGAENISLAKACWMCHRDLHDIAAVYRAEPARPAFAPSEGHTVLVAVVSGLLVLLVGFGVATNGVGALIPFAIIAVPALLATVVRVGRKSARGEQVGIVQTVGTFLLSGVAVIGLMFTLCIAAIAGLFIYCLAGGI